MIYYLLAFFSGVASTLQAGVNGKLQAALGTPLLAACISFAVGCVGLGLAYLAAIHFHWQAIPPSGALSKTEPWMWLGGLLGALFVFSTIVCGPEIGFASLFNLIISGQILFSLIVDHYGLLGAPVHALSPARLGGVALLLVGGYLIQSK